MIQINQLSKEYKTGRVGLYPIDYSIPEGSIVALTGGNGAGKSTFIKLLTNIIRPSSGSIHWAGHQISYMPDDLEFPPNLTAIEGLELLGSLKRVGKERTTDLLKKVDLFKVRNEKIASFSKGMKQRLSFAQTLLSNETVLILDEPTNGLDPYWIKWLKSCLLEEKNKGKTIIFSTHDLSFVEEIADEMLFFYQGKLLIGDKVKELTKEVSLEDSIVSKLEELISQNK